MFNASHFEMSMREHFKEMEYLRLRLKEAEGVIEQLHRGYPVPGKPVYIHPYDFSVILNDATRDISFSLVNSLDSTRNFSNTVIKGVEYRQTTAMPQYTKEIK